MTITLRPPIGAQVGQEFKTNLTLMDVSRADPLQVELTLRIAPAVDKGTSPASTKRSHRQELALPEIKRVSRDEWPIFGFDEDSAIAFKSNGTDGLDAIVNIDNVHLQRELSQRLRTQNEPELIKRQFELGLLVTGLALREKLEGLENRDDLLSTTTAGIAKIIIPTVRVLGQIHDVIPTNVRTSQV